MPAYLIRPAHPMLLGKIIAWPQTPIRYWLKIFENAPAVNYELII